MVYLKELQNYFNEILLITNSRGIENADTIEALNIRLVQVKNEGYDFGMFYKAFQKITLDSYSQVACINDSNVIFGSLRFLFEWGNRQPIGFWGLVDSYQHPSYSVHTDNYHLQSHFIVFNREAIEKLGDFLQQINYNDLVNEKNTSLLKKKVINDWEIGITQFLISKGVRCAAYINSKRYSQKYRKGKPVNVPTKLYTKTIAQGIPVLKKRVITSTDLRHILKYKGNWKRLIRRYGEKEYDIDDMIKELGLIRKKHVKNKFLKIIRGI